jgi:hypothetical protein
MNKEITSINRRQFLELSIVSFFVLAGLVPEGSGPRSMDSTWKVTLDADGHLDYQAISDLAWRFDVLADTIDRTVTEKQVLLGQEDLSEWMDEIVPQLEVEGITQKAHYPETSTFEYFTSADNHIYQLGSSDCERNISISARVINPHSAWYQKNILAALTHELVHIQQSPIMCYQRDSELLDVSATIATWEVLAALANLGNPEACFALIKELKNLCLVTIIGRDLSSGLTHFPLDQELNPGAINEAINHRLVSQYVANKDAISTIIERYYEQPLRKVFQAYQNNSNVVPNLALDGSCYYSSMGCKDYDAPLTSLDINDLIYFIGHAEELTYAYIALKRN